MKTLTLDYSKWRCGMNGENALGTGNTSLHNSVGLECCLGQFSKQLDKSLTDEMIYADASPQDIGKKILLLTKKEETYFINTRFSKKAMIINDDTKTTPAVKISKLRMLLRKYRYMLRVIHKPKN